jgi:hypothetical protein
VYSKIDITDAYRSSINATIPVNVFKIPLQMEYIYPKGKVKPVFAYGLNVYRPFNFTAAAMVGLNVELLDKTILTFNYDIDFVPYILVLPSSFFSHTPSFGLKVKF